ncbi:hypothetical protein Pint_34253 [Pistacia integerrima]|uniref:Uncharacterized protein n=1 Tax=Pistacia integerrima TaxID=434235 RepID=A0ACC0X4K1_9ROSI|nr:hypothetical protein Pint_34253 [Pistacia integerrima]
MQMNSEEEEHQETSSRNSSLLNLATVLGRCSIVCAFRHMPDLRYNSSRELQVPIYILARHCDARKKESRISREEERKRKEEKKGKTGT